MTPGSQFQTAGLAGRGSCPLGNLAPWRLVLRLISWPCAEVNEVLSSRLCGGVPGLGLFRLFRERERGTRMKLCPQLRPCLMERDDADMLRQMLVAEGRFPLPGFVHMGQAPVAFTLNQHIPTNGRQGDFLFFGFLHRLPSHTRATMLLRSCQCLASRAPTLLPKVCRATRRTGFRLLVGATGGNTPWRGQGKMAR